MPPVPEDQQPNDMTLDQLLADRRFTPTQRQIAQYMREHGDEVPFLSADELATQVGVSQASVSRFTAALGFRSYQELQRATRPPATPARPDGDGRPTHFEAAIDSEIRALQSLRTNLGDPGRLTEAGALLAASPAIGVVGFRQCAFLARHFSYLAARIHPDVHAVAFEGTRGLDELHQLRGRGGKWVVCFAFPRYARELVTVLDDATELGLRIISIADQGAAAVTERSEITLYCHPTENLVFDSLAAALVMSGLLLQAIVDATPAAAQERLESFEKLAARRKVFLRY